MIFYEGGLLLVANLWGYFREGEVKKRRVFTFF